MGELESKPPAKYLLISVGLLGSLLILLACVVKLSVIQHGYFTNLSRENRMNESVIPAARGKILDRKGRVIAQSIYQYFSTQNGTKVFEEGGDYKGQKFEGKDLAYDLRRQYPYGETLAFVSGYVSKFNDEDLKDYKCLSGKYQEDVVGRGGVEEWFDCQLRGENGRRLIETDARGKYIRELGREEPISGEDLELSIDAYWQDKIYKLLSGRKIAVIMSEPATGKILALISSPAFNPNDFSYQKDNNLIKTYLNDAERMPLLNRAVAAKYHPGSVFKIVMSSAGLETGTITKDSTYEDTGVLKVGDYSFSNWLWTRNGGTDGMVNVVKALKRSNDIFFYRLGGDLGVDNIKVWANKFGYGEKTGVEIPGELPGIVPDDKWKQEAKGERWYLGNTYHLSIGQGDLDVTPLQVNQMTNVIASRGSKCDLSLLKEGRGNCKSIGLSSQTLDLITEGMREACKTGGTAWPLFNFKTNIACKTGTAEVGDGTKDTHAWLTAFAPIENPQVSITVMVERGGEGSDEAAPIVGDILKDWFEEPNTLVPRYKPTGTATGE